MISKRKPSTNLVQSMEYTYIHFLIEFSFCILWDQLFPSHTHSSGHSESHIMQTKNSSQTVVISSFELTFPKANTLKKTMFILPFLEWRHWRTVPSCPAMEATCTVPTISSQWKLRRNWGRTTLVCFRSANCSTAGSSRRLWNRQKNIYNNKKFISDLAKEEILSKYYTFAAGAEHEGNVCVCFFCIIILFICVCIGFPDVLVRKNCSGYLEILKVFGNVLYYSLCEWWELFRSVDSLKLMSIDFVDLLGCLFFEFIFVFLIRKMNIVIMMV